MRQPEPRAQAVFFCDFPTLMIFAGFSKNCAVSARAAGTEEQNDFQNPARQSARQSGKFSRLPREKNRRKILDFKNKPVVCGTHRNILQVYEISLDFLKVRGYLTVACLVVDVGQPHILRQEPVCGLHRLKK